MCLILDTNRFSIALANPTDDDHLPLINWVIGNQGFLVYGGTKYAAEIRASRAATRFFAERARAGQARLLDREVIDAEERKLQEKGLCRSDDEHIMALARVSGARVVCTDDDDLMVDVRNPTLLSKPRGRVYKRAEHQGLLHHDPHCQRPAKGQSRKRGR